jgi:hypothetical protein
MSVGGRCSIQGCKRTHMYNSPVCYKHKGQKPSPKEYERASGEDLWWTDDDEGQRCDDTPDTAVCEFDTYDGICWHCKNMVYPDIHLIHLIGNRRRGHRLLESFHTIEGEDLDPELEDALDRILDPLEERDITSHPNLPPEDRVKALKEMDDREHILTELEASFPDWKERGLSQFNLEPDGFGLGELIHRLYNDIHAFNQEEWGPGWAAEWGLEKPERLPSSLRIDSGGRNYHSTGRYLNPIAHVIVLIYLLGCFNWIINHSPSHWDPEDGEFIAMLMFVPIPFIYSLFSYDIPE